MGLLPYPMSYIAGLRFSSHIANARLCPSHPFCNAREWPRRKVLLVSFVLLGRIAATRAHPAFVNLSRAFCSHLFRAYYLCIRPGALQCAHFSSVRGGTVTPGGKPLQGVSIMTKRYQSDDWLTMDIKHNACVGSLKRKLITDLGADRKADETTLYISFSEDGDKLLFPLKAYESLEEGLKRAIAHFERHQFLHAGELVPLTEEFPRHINDLARESQALREAFTAANKAGAHKGKALQAVRDAFRTFKLTYDVMGFRVTALDEGVDTIKDSWGPLKAAKAALAASERPETGAPRRGRVPRLRLVLGRSGLGEEYARTGIKAVKTGYLMLSESLASDSSDASDASDSEAVWPDSDVELVSDSEAEASSDSDSASDSDSDSGAAPSVSPKADSWSVRTKISGPPEFINTVVAAKNAHAQRAAAAGSGRVPLPVRPPADASPEAQHQWALETMEHVLARARAGVIQPGRIVDELNAAGFNLQPVSKAVITGKWQPSDSDSDSDSDASSSRKHKPRKH